MHSLIYELRDVEQRTESNVVSIQAAGSPSIYEVELENGERLLADDVYITAPNFSAADLLRPHMDVTALEAVDYVSVANLVMAFNKKDIVNEYDGSVFLCLVKKGEILLPAHGHLRNGRIRLLMIRCFYAVMWVVLMMNRMFSCLMRL